MVNSLASGILNSIPGLESVNEIIEMNDEKLINDLYKLKNKILPKLRNELENTKKEYEEKSNTKNKNNDDDSNDDDSNDDILNKEKIENKSYIKNITDNYDEIK
jgi:hypothetical protein